MTKVHAPFTADQVAKLDNFQRDPRFHPFTCQNRGDGNHRDNDIDLGVLVPTIRGWVCPYCDYTQDWAHDFMTQASQPDNKVEHMQKLLNGRDDFIVAKGLWDEFVRTLK